MISSKQHILCTKLLPEHGQLLWLKARRLQYVQNTMPVQALCSLQAASHLHAHLGTPGNQPAAAHPAAPGKGQPFMLLQQQRSPSTL
jgi:hypothetical protein